MTKRRAEWVLMALIFGVGLVWAVPPNPEAVRTGEFLKKLMQRPLSERRLTPEEAQRFQRELKGFWDAATCAALILAWAEDVASMESLKTLGNEARYPLTRDAASYALNIQKLRVPNVDYFKSLCVLVRETTNCWESLFYASCLYNDFGEEALHEILEASKRCDDPVISWYFLSFLSSTKCDKIAAEAVELFKDKDLVWDTTDSIFTIVSSLVPNRKIVMPGIAMERLRERLEDKRVSDCRCGKN